jgi:hypothetical protein
MNDFADSHASGESVGAGWNAIYVPSSYITEIYLAEMTNQYMTAFAEDPIIRAAVMQSADSEYCLSVLVRLLLISLKASQPMWPLNDQISKIATNMSCPTGHGLLDCLRTKSATDLQKVLLATGTQFQPVTDNVTIWKE